jgi:hypothetical protein
MAINRMPVDPDAGIPDLVRRLTDDSKRLVADEVRLVKLETTENLHRAGKGAMWLGVAFGVSVVMLVAVTLFLTTLIGRLWAGHMWAGAIFTGIVEVVVGVVLIKRGLRAFAQPSYTMVETRGSLGLAKE